MTSTEGERRSSYRHQPGAYMEPAFDRTLYTKTLESAYGQTLELRLLCSGPTGLPVLEVRIRQPCDRWVGSSVGVTEESIRATFLLDPDVLGGPYSCDEVLRYLHRLGSPGALPTWRPMLELADHYGTKITMDNPSSNSTKFRRIRLKGSILDLQWTGLTSDLIDPSSLIRVKARGQLLARSVPQVPGWYVTKASFGPRRFAYVDYTLATVPALAAYWTEGLLPDDLLAVAWELDGDGLPIRVDDQVGGRYSSFNTEATIKYMEES